MHTGVKPRHDLRINTRHTNSVMTALTSGRLESVPDHKLKIKRYHSRPNCTIFLLSALEASAGIVQYVLNGMELYLQAALRPKPHQQLACEAEYSAAPALHDPFCAVLCAAVGCQDQQLLQLCHILERPSTHGGNAAFAFVSFFLVGFPPPLLSLLPFFELS